MKKKKKQQYDETVFAKTVQESPLLDFYPRLLTKNTNKEKKQSHPIWERNSNQSFRKKLTNRKYRFVRFLRSPPERELWVRALAGDIVYCSWARHFTLTVPLFSQVYNWIPTSLVVGDNPVMD